MTAPRDHFVGRWWITSIEGWEKPNVDLLGPAHIEFDRRGTGGFQFCAVMGDIDYRVAAEPDGPVVAWSWVGDDDGTETSGRGWAHLQHATLVGIIFVHCGDEFAFEASLAKPRASHRGVTRRRLTV